MQERDGHQRALPLGRDTTATDAVKSVKPEVIELLSKLLVEVVRAERRAGEERDDE